jgi:hypothetical protein
MKKAFKSKGFIVTSLAVLCVTILGTCWYVSRDKNDPFLPEESSPASTTASDWSENSSQTGDNNSANAYTSPQPTTQPEEYPKVVEESGDEVVIDFTDTEKPETTPPPAPEGKTIKEDPGPQHPVNRAPDVTVPAATTSTTEAEASNTPAPGSSNGNGEYYDPVFGWVKPAEVIQSTVDSDGDPNKMVGNMGN